MNTGRDFYWQNKTFEISFESDCLHLNKAKQKRKCVERALLIYPSISPQLSLGASQTGNGDCNRLLFHYSSWVFLHNYANMKQEAQSWLYVLFVYRKALDQILQTSHEMLPGTNNINTSLYKKTKRPFFTVNLITYLILLFNLLSLLLFVYNLSSSADVHIRKQKSQVFVISYYSGGIVVFIICKGLQQNRIAFSSPQGGFWLLSLVLRHKIFHFSK